MRSWRRYSTARSAFHESKTALMARSSCSRGSCGKSRPVCSAKISLYVVTSVAQVVGVQVEVVARCSWRAWPSSRACSNASPGTSQTVLPNIWISRR